MAVNLDIPSRESILPIGGIEIGITSAGVRKAGKADLTVFKLAPGSSVAGVFTSNRFRAAPVTVCEQHLAQNASIGALVINTGNANAGTGERGMRDAQTMCQATGEALGIDAQSVLPFSTGVILEPLPIERIVAAIPHAASHMSATGWFDAAHSIMTTDTLPKIYSREIQISGKTVRITGISKGAGMIRPNMATMLGYLATDAAIPAEVIQSVVRRVADRSFNRITVDGDMSTNDSFVLMATGAGAGALQIADAHDRALPALEQALTDAAKDLACKIVRDAEGATKFMTIRIEDAGNTEEALAVAYAIAHSPLVKTAFYASDPNLGRILAAIGYAGISDLDVSCVRLWLGDVLVASHGARDPNYQEADGQRVMAEAEILVRVSLGRGAASETVYTCDFSQEYVSINADYRS
jgi:glutamate N-acetyltransferase / amino-acid N-acetyltransferase